MTRARDMANLGSQAGSGLDASDITTGVLPAGVTGGSGLTHLALNPTVTLGSNATFPAIMTNGGGNVRWRHTHYRSEGGASRDIGTYWDNYVIGPTSILGENFERTINLWIELKCTWTANYYLHGPAEVHYNGGIVLYQPQITGKYGVTLEIATVDSNYVLKFLISVYDNITSPFEGSILQSSNVDFTAA